MRRALLPLLLIAVIPIGATGCSIVFKPDRDAIAPDLDSGTDAGMDAFVPLPDGDAGDLDGGVDGGLDGGPDACVARQSFEVSCNDGRDNDCDGLADCEDFDCGASGSCCDLSTGAPWDEPNADYNAGSWIALPAESGPAAVSADAISFVGQSAMLFGRCASLAYGASFRVSVSQSAGGSGADYASLVLTPAADAAPGEPLPAELAVRVYDDSRVTVEQAGTELAMSGPLPAGTTELFVDVVPGFDEAGGAVMRATVYAVDATDVRRPLLDDVAFMPSADLRGPTAPRGGCEPDGLFVALEGRGARVTIASKLGVTLGECANPREFEPDATLEPLIEQLAPGAWRMGGVGEPALQNFNDADRLELWVDAAELERADEIFRPVEYTLGAAFQLGLGLWQQRLLGGSDPTVVDVNSREPSIAAPIDASGRLVGDDLWLSYASERAEGPETYELAVTRIRRSPGQPPETGPLTVAPADPCISLRDPSLVSLTEDPTVAGASFLLFYTCEHAGVAPDSIGVMRLDWEGDAGTGRLAVATNSPNWLTASDDDYALRGVFSPEVVAHPDPSGGHAIRMWYLARDASGPVRVAFAYGTFAEGAMEPEITPYAGNPVLDAESLVLGAADCSLGCTLESLAVTPTLGTSTRWMRPYYLLVIERTRHTGAGVMHELVPLLQLRPSEL